MNSLPMTTRNVILALLGAAMLVLKGYYRGPFEEGFLSYAGNVSVSFALYFAVLNATEKRRWPRIAAAGIVLLAVEGFEVMDGFGIMANVQDRGDYIANAVGVALAIAVDIATRRMLRSHDGPARSA